MTKLAALKAAESFIAGFEDDELQDGIGALLAQIRAEIAQPKTPKAVRKTQFSRAGYSFRPVTVNGQPGFDIYPLRERSHWAKRGTVCQGSDGATWLFYPSSGYADARPDFESIVALVLQALGAKA